MTHDTIKPMAQRSRLSTDASEEFLVELARELNMQRIETNNPLLKQREFVLNALAKTYPRLKSAVDVELAAPHTLQKALRYEVRKPSNE